MAAVTTELQNVQSSSPTAATNTPIFVFLQARYHFYPHQPTNHV